MADLNDVKGAISEVRSKGVDVCASNIYQSFNMILSNGLWFYNSG